MNKITLSVIILVPLTTIIVLWPLNDFKGIAMGVIQFLTLLIAMIQQEEAWK